MRMEPETSTKPGAGVIATRPATAPAAIPSTLGRPLWIQDTVSQVRPAIAVAVFVTTNALVARPPAARALPALKPNQPNQRSDAPRIVIVASCGSLVLSRRPMRIAATRADTPLEMWTTVPPAKSSAPRVCSQRPVPQTQGAIGSYTRVAHASEKRTYALKLTRSAKDPVMSAGVMTANIIWNAMNA